MESNMISLVVVAVGMTVVFYLGRSAGRREGEIRGTFQASIFFKKFLLSLGMERCIELTKELEQYISQKEQEERIKKKQS